MSHPAQAAPLAFTSVLKVLAKAHAHSVTSLTSLQGAANHAVVNAANVLAHQSIA
jgi:hypothetical protein